MEGCTTFSTATVSHREVMVNDSSEVSVTHMPWNSREWEAYSNLELLCLIEREIIRPFLIMRW